MQISKQQVSLRDEPDYDKLLYLVEQAGRVCYNSESALDRDSGEKFVRRLIKMGHESVLEHATLSFMIETDRATANQIVRHRLLSFSQQSQRYVKYNNLEVIIPERHDMTHRILRYEDYAVLRVRNTLLFLCLLL